MKIKYFIIMSSRREKIIFYNKMSSRYEKALCNYIFSKSLDNIHPFKKEIFVILLYR